jgi:hypothetical protein
MTQNEPNLKAQIPDMFRAQKECCFRAMERDAFPRSLRSKAFGNLTPALVRLVVGLIVLWIRLAVGFSLILDVQPKSKCFSLFIPFSIAVLCLISLIRTGPHPRLPWPIRNNTFPYPAPYVKLLLARLARSSGGTGDSPQMVDPACTRSISPVHANNWQWWWRWCVG